MCYFFMKKRIPVKFICYRFPFVLVFEVVVEQCVTARELKDWCQQEHNKNED